ncbi:unnamed protein product [Ostreobium quekettii]|uniref:Uncharacterized protein n=1 Tax=Ostreobium quekettii TaxID=121088 RepID=A0A8S1IZP9_9CHLO|nr:unnamed protein product [Ostreobium quekettii]
MAAGRGGSGQLAWRHRSHEILITECVLTLLETELRPDRERQLGVFLVGREASTCPASVYTALCSQCWQEGVRRALAAPHLLCRMEMWYRGLLNGCGAQHDGRPSQGEAILRGTACTVCSMVHT